MMQELDIAVCDNIINDLMEKDQPNYNAAPFLYQKSFKQKMEQMDQQNYQINLETGLNKSKVLFYDYEEVSEDLQYFEEVKDYQSSEHSIQLQLIQNIDKNSLSKDSSCSKKQKNSNTIKKMGRIIMDSIKQYDISNKINIPILNMLKTLSKNSKVGTVEKNKRDKFNTFHLKMMFDTKDKKILKHNLKITNLVLNKLLRKNVLNSKQITGRNKIVYLNTLKCSSLRCINKKLVTRLQMSD